MGHGLSVHGHHDSIPPLTMAPAGTGFTLETRFIGEREAVIACSFDEDQIQPFSLAHLTLTASLWANPPAPGLATSLLRCHVRLPRQEVWVQVSKAVAAARLLPGESPCPSICQHGCVWRPA